jgi:hypothetical protein
MKIGVVGYGTGRQHFHTPFIAAARNCELAGIVARAHLPKPCSHVRGGCLRDSNDHHPASDP